MRARHFLLALGAVALASAALSGCRAERSERLEPVAALAVTAAAAPGAPVLAAVAPAAPAADDEPAACPGGMVLVEGDYCPDVLHRCRRYMDPPGRYEEFRCAEYAQPATCRSKERVHKRFCIDRDEYTPPGQSLPANFQSWTRANQVCRSLGKRMCMESEYNFACEGEEMRPYPYGWKRDSTACNADHQDVVGSDGKLIDRRAPGGSYPRCESPFGVRDLAGNVEEFVTIDRAGPPQPAMKGAYWQPSRNFCRAAQTAHDQYYNGMETGFRCCADAP
ncbi:MAG: SUMF1/EgtB/PvdO family nonheme iron enzyme [Polyangiaceae bacterium]|nr:SUMF1/EgtB/PvdO family nonheme iron enzyme [Polyangiaceae bacterium]